MVSQSAGITAYNNVNLSINYHKSLIAMNQIVFILISPNEHYKQSSLKLVNVAVNLQFCINNSDKLQNLISVSRKFQTKTTMTKLVSPTN